MGTIVKAITNKIFHSTDFLRFEAYRNYNAYKPIIEIDRNMQQTILVLGSGRSGTTWIAEVIAKMMKARLIFEPFLLDQEKQFYLLNTRYASNELWSHHQLYLSPSELHNDYHEQIKRILQGGIRSELTDSGCKPGIYSRRVIKDVRINLLMAYIATHWPEIKIVWLIRNPFDVIESQLTLMEKDGWHFEFDVQSILDQPYLVNDWLGPYVPGMISAATPYEKLAHKWCIETFVPIKQGVDTLPNVLKISYDNLTLNKEVWNKVFLFLTGAAPGGELASLLSKQSRTSRPKSLRHKNRIDPINLKAISTIIKSYGLEGFIDKGQY